MYKRQVINDVDALATLAVAKNPDITMAIESPIFNSFLIFFISFHPVSYTHLDVYKRQVVKQGSLK